MSTEIVIDESTTEVAAPPPIVPPSNGETHTAEAKAAVPRKQRRVRNADDEEDEDASGAPKLTKPLRELQTAEDKNLRDYLTDLGLDNATVRIDIYRQEPDKVMDPKTGKSIKTNGHLESVKQFIDEEYIREKHGGGTYKLKINTPGADGKYHYFKMRELHVGGDPRTEYLPRNVEAPAAAGAASAANQSESPSIVRDVLGVMKDQLDKANERGRGPAGPSTPDPAMVMLIEQMRAQNEAQAAEMRAMRLEITEARKVVAPQDTYKDTLLNTFIAGDSARIDALRAQFDSELRMAKEHEKQLEDRLRDQFDRERTQLVNMHTAQLAASEAAHARELALMKHSQDINVGSVKMSLDTSQQVLNAQIKQLERELVTIREENKDLRAKKEKSPLEMAKEFKVYQETFGSDDKGEESTVEKIVAALPQAIEVAQGIINKNKPATAPAQQAPQQNRIVRDSDGNSFQQRPNGQLIPIKKRGQKVAVPAVTEGQPPTEVEIPAIDPEKLANAISYLEKAFSGNQEPATVATSVRPFLAEEIMQSIQSLGIDVFFAKVAKLPSASPLTSQAGKNWVRKVGKALVGE